MLTVFRQSVTVPRRVKSKTQQIQLKLIKHRLAHSSVCQGGEEHHNSRAVGKRQQKIDLLLPRFKTMESQYQKAIETLNNELQTNFAVLEQVRQAFFVRTLFCPKRKMFPFSGAHSHALTNATRRHKYF